MSDGQGPSPRELIGLSREVLSGRHRLPAAQTPRAAALLARQALEETVSRWGQGVGLTDTRVSMRTRLISLRTLGDRHTAQLAAHAWYGLSAACHHHAYELTPAPAEIRRLIDRTTELIDRVDAER